MDEQREETFPQPNIQQAETALFARFLAKLDDGRYDECHKITGLMERLSLI